MARKKQTYENYFKAYYEANKERIIDNAREYKKKYNKKYYQEHKSLVITKKKIKRRVKADLKKPDKWFYILNE